MIERAVNWLAPRWLLLSIIAWGIFVWLPWLAPVFMQWGWEPAAYRIYALYSVTCHQLPQRSFFLFGDLGSQGMYELDFVQYAYKETTNLLELRRFIGSPALGWKVAWSDRMVSFYGGIWLWLVVWYAAPRRRLPRLSFLAFVWLAWPMAVDGVTHMVSTSCMILAAVSATQTTGWHCSQAIGLPLRFIRVIALARSTR